MKLVVSDVDHTLVSEDRLFKPVLVEAIKEFQSSGNEFVLCSGRPTISLINTAMMLKDQGVSLNYVSGFNGAEVYDLNQKELVYQNGLSLTETKDICASLTSLGLEFALYKDDRLYVSDLNNEYAKVEQDIVKLDIFALDEVFQSVKILGFVDPVDNEAMRTKLKQLHPGFEFVYSQPFFIEITKPGVNKALALKALEDILHVNHGNTYGFGDGENDRALIEYANQGIVVANAKPEIQAIADEVIDSVYDDGVAKYINLHFNNES